MFINAVFPIDRSGPSVGEGAGRHDPKRRAAGEGRRRIVGDHRTMNRPRVPNSQEDCKVPNQEICPQMSLMNADEAGESRERIKSENPTTGNCRPPALPFLTSLLPHLRGSAKSADRSL